MKSRPKTRDTLARNLAYLMDHQQDGYWSQEKVATKAGVSQRTVSNMLNPDSHSPKLESVDMVARAFGLEGWHLILPNLIDDLQSDTSIRKIYDAYVEANTEGRRHIQRVAEREAEFHRSGSHERSKAGNGG